MKLTALLYLPLFACLFVIAISTTSCKGDGNANSSDTAINDDEAKKLDKDQFTKEMKRSGSVIVDVRMPQEFEQGHIEGAININFFDPQFKYKLLELDREKSYYLYDKKESKSFRAMKFMEDNGFTKVRMLKGGWEEWSTVHAPQDTTANK
ncbi:MAG TPA: rhodanese-like domain-containing protein [Saprospiraceae bacterium]|nr:rhodanese-like domain-containing protein [Saprospiraceae bacterium]